MSQRGQVSKGKSRLLWEKESWGLGKQATNVQHWKACVLPSALPYEVLTDVVASGRRALYSQDTDAVVLASFSAVPASKLLRPDKKASSHLRVSHLLHKQQSGTFTQMLTDPDVFEAQCGQPQG